MNYEKKYKEANDKIATRFGTNVAKEIFTDLYESEDERIRKELLEHCKNQAKPYIQTGNKCPQIQSWIAWLEKQHEQKPVISDDALREGIAHFGITQYQIDNWLKKYVDIEKQGEQKSADKVEPKFKVGDWILYSGDHYEGVRHITKINENGYYIERNGLPHGIIPFNHEICMRLWTIQNAKDGDVLAIDPWSDYPSSFVAIYKKQNGEDFDSYCFVGFDGKFYKGENGHSTEEIHPATKEQRDLLFQKMRESGYEWNAENKELKKIEWSEEDEKFFKTALWHISYSISNGKSPDIHCDTIEWLKSLKERIGG